MFKRILIITIVLIIIAFGVWFFLSSVPQEEPPKTGSRFEFPTQEERKVSTQDESNDQTEDDPDGVPDSQYTTIPADETIDFVEEGISLTKITERGVAGGFSSGTKDTLDLSLRYIERDTGYAYEYIFDEGAIRKLTSNSIPGIIKALWLDKDRVVVRYKDEGVTKTFAGGITTEEEGEGMLIGNFLPNNISEITIAPADVVSSDVFYTTTETHGTNGYLSDFSGQNEARVFSSPLKEWLIDWPSRFVLSLNTKASGNIPGYFYEINSTTRSSDDSALNKIIGGKNGLLSLLNNDGTRVFYSYKTGGLLTNRTLEVELGKETELDTQTLPEKCVWSKDNIHIYCGVPTSVPSGNYPDDWYAGIIQFNDNILRIDSRTGGTDVLMVAGFDVQEELDIIDLFLSEEEDYLFFKNKRDGSLWMLLLS